MTLPPNSFAVRRWWPLVLLSGLGLLALLWQWPRTAKPAAQESYMAALPVGRPLAFDSSRLRGVNWVGSDSVTAAQLVPLRKAGVTWIAQTPFGWQSGAADPVIRTLTGRPVGRYGLWGAVSYTHLTLPTKA